MTSLLKRYSAATLNFTGGLFHHAEGKGRIESRSFCARADAATSMNTISAASDFVNETRGQAAIDAVTERRAVQMPARSASPDICSCRMAALSELSRAA